MNDKMKRERTVNVFLNFWLWTEIWIIFTSNSGIWCYGSRKKRFSPKIEKTIFQLKRNQGTTRRDDDNKEHPRWFLFERIEWKTLITIPIGNGSEYFGRKNNLIRTWSIKMTKQNLTRKVRTRSEEELS